MKYTVEHNVGTQGVNEKTVESVTVEAPSAEDAITFVAGQNASRAPENTGSGSWVDYWCAFEVEA